ncbi:cytochrome P450 [Halomicroarcula sp. S1AR25-4]|uniref:cytochrome P450 n=1 Tax=Haloarcula sp. S1AR25-4 TaxID=2950538 RepID=UPI002874CE36|nr:cytochrome P450 [Halomicroarcula sp. S1AR25-4]MDS0279613.1 cytochrome P450 [Halomicroarcula sp. S1AR25-4]
MPRTNSRPPTPPGKPVVGHTAAFVSDPFGFVRQSVDSTGDAFRMQLLGKDVYVLAHPDYVGTALSNPDTFAKPDDFEVAFGDALLAVEGDQWQRQRHSMEPFFSPRRLADHAETMTEVAASRVADWASGESVHVDEEMKAIALHNLFEVVLGQSLSDEEIDELSTAAQALNLWFKPTSWALPEWVPTPARHKFKRGSAELRERARTLLAASGERPQEDSLLATLAELRDDPDSAYDQSEVLDQVVGMLFAGHETTALAMTYALHQIATHPTVADRFHAEIDAVLDGRPSFDQLQELDYLERIVDETLRLYPPVHAIPRVTTESVGVGDYAIPEGATVLLSVWCLHRDPRFYDDPLTFDPGRWAETSPRDRGHAFVPFGAGPRTCIGRHFARLEAKAVLAEIGRRYRLDADSGIEVAPQMTTQPEGPVNLRVSDRT